LVFVFLNNILFNYILAKIPDYGLLLGFYAIARPFENPMFIFLIIKSSFIL
jgi:hypothetical protein